MCVCLALKLYLSCVLHFLRSHGTIHGPSNSTKCRFLSKFRSHNTIHTFKNYFVLTFLIISFQFLTIKDIKTTLIKSSNLTLFRVFFTFFCFFVVSACVSFCLFLPFLSYCTRWRRNEIIMHCIFVFHTQKWKQYF